MGETQAQLHLSAGHVFLRLHNDVVQQGLHGLYAQIVRVRRFAHGLVIPVVAHPPQGISLGRGIEVVEYRRNRAVQVIQGGDHHMEVVDELVLVAHQGIRPGEPSAQDAVHVQHLVTEGVELVHASPVTTTVYHLREKVGLIGVAIVGIKGEILVQPAQLAQEGVHAHYHAVGDGGNGRCMRGAFENLRVVLVNLRGNVAVLLLSPAGKVALAPGQFRIQFHIGLAEGLPFRRKPAFLPGLGPDGEHVFIDGASQGETGPMTAHMAHIKGFIALRGRCRDRLVHGIEVMDAAGTFDIGINLFTGVVLSLGQHRDKKEKAKRRNFFHNKSFCKDRKKILRFAQNDRGSE